MATDHPLHIPLVEALTLRKRLLYAQGKQTKEANQMDYQARTMIASHAIGLLYFVAATMWSATAMIYFL